MSTDLKWTSQSRKLSQLKPATYNPRKLSPEQEKRLTDSIAKFDVCDPIIINSDDTIIGGHQRIKVLSKQGVESVDVRVPSRQLSIEEEKELNVRLNKNLGEWDFNLLKDLDMNMLKDVGFDSLELDKIFPVTSDEKDDDVPEVKEETTTKTGDIFQLGRHRVMCGDSTDAGSVAVLMEGKKADMVFTDPPYGVDYSGGIQFTKSGVKKEQRDRLLNDDVDIYGCVVPILADICDGPIYIWFADTKARTLYEAVDSVGDIHALLIWKKNGGYAALNAHYKQKHEPCLYWKSKGKNLKWGGESTESTIWDIDKDGVNNLHPTQKPVELACKAIRNHSVELVVDLFLGSGSTLIACEKTNRICYGMEIDPHYVDVIVKRWEDFTGNKAEKIANG